MSDRDRAQLDRDLVAQAQREMPRLIPFFIENWSPAWRALSIQTEMLALEPALLEPVFAFVKTFGQGDPWKVAGDGIWPFVQWCEQAIKMVGGRGFVRLGSRSPKDNPELMGTDLRPTPVYSGRQAMESLGYSERVYLDLLDARHVNYTPYCCIRRWIHLDPDQEFRCFIEDGKFAGMTQYYLDDGPSSWIRKNRTAIEATLRAYLLDVVLSLSPLGTSFTCDVILSWDMRPTLLEINPPVSSGKVFPGLFTGMDDLDGSFRFIQNSV